MTTLIRPVHPSHWTNELGIYAPFPTLGDEELFVFNPDRFVYEYCPGLTWEQYIVGADDDDCQGVSICVRDTDDDIPF
jgi:hypothetical protein